MLDSLLIFLMIFEHQLIELLLQERLPWKKNAMLQTLNG
jgi:hypothetical protein